MPQSRTRVLVAIGLALAAAGFFLLRPKASSGATSAGVDPASATYGSSSGAGGAAAQLSQENAALLAALIAANQPFLPTVPGPDEGGTAEPSRLPAGIEPPAATGPRPPVPEPPADITRPPLPQQNGQMPTPDTGRVPLDLAVSANVAHGASARPVVPEPPAGIDRPPLPSTNGQIPDVSAASASGRPSVPEPPAPVPRPRIPASV